jgi:hypothetical protein
MQLTEAGVLSLSALTFGFLAGLLSCVLRSRCHTIKCCGCHFERDVLENIETDVEVRT